MKKFIATILALTMAFTLISSAAFAEKAIPERYLPILQDWDASTAEELHLNIIEYWKSIDTIPDNEDHWTSKHYPCKMRFGGTTKELIADRKNWDLAIVSSKDVNLQELIDHKALNSGEYFPVYSPAFHQWLLPDELSYVLGDPEQISAVYVYAYDAQTDDATLLLCNQTVYTDNPPMPRLFAETIMWKRSAEIARAVQGIRVIPDEARWTEEDFLAHRDEWDWGILRVTKEQLPSDLDQAGLLYDFSQNDYFASRPSVDLPSYQVDLANGVFNTNNQMIGIPCVEMHVSEPDTVGMLIVNAKSPALERALEYAEYYVKTLEWEWDISRAQGGGIIPGISRDAVDWWLPTKEGDY